MSKFIATMILTVLISGPIAAYIGVAFELNELANLLTGMAVGAITTLCLLRISREI